MQKQYHDVYCVIYGNMLRNETHTRSVELLYVVAYFKTATCERVVSDLIATVLFNDPSGKMTNDWCSKASLNSYL